MSGNDYVDLSIANQEYRAKVITDLRSSIDADKGNSLSLLQLKHLLKRNEGTYNEFKVVHEKLLDASSRIENASELPYFKDDTLSTVTANYLRSEDILVSLFSKLEDSNKSVEVLENNLTITGGENPSPSAQQKASNARENPPSSETTQNALSPLHTTRIALNGTYPAVIPPAQFNASQSAAAETSQFLHMQSWAHNAQKLNLPKFNGDYSKWRSFSQLFMHIYGKNQFLSDAMKLAFLRQNLEGEPLDLIEHISVDDESFASGWDILRDQYENSRLIYAAHVDKLLGKEWMEGSPPLTAAQIHRIRNDITENVNALKAVNAPVQHWSPIIILAAVKRLDAKLRKNWELHLGDSTEMPSLQTFKTFLLTHARAVECIEINGGVTTAVASKSAAKPPTKAQAGSQFSTKPQTTFAPTNSFQSQSQSQGSRTCFKCKGPHLTIHCGDFRSMNRDDKSRFVDAHQLCRNCVGSHATQNCRSNNNCYHCGERHHSLLCPIQDSQPESSNHATYSQAPQVTQGGSPWPFKTPRDPA